MKDAAGSARTSNHFGCDELSARLYSDLREKSEYCYIMPIPRMKTSHRSTRHPWSITLSPVV
jgi:hypothetical protein